MAKSIDAMESGRINQVTSLAVAFQEIKNTTTYSKPISEDKN